MRLFIVYCLTSFSVLAQGTIGVGQIGTVFGAISSGGGGGGPPQLLQVVTNNGSGSTFALTNAMTVSGANPIIVWFFSSSSLTAAPTNVQWNGTSATLWTNGGNGVETNWMYYLLSPAAGSFNAWAMVNVSATMYLTTAIFTNCSGIETPATNDLGSVLTISNICNSAANDLMLAYNTYSDQIGSGGIQPTMLFSVEKAISTNVIGGNFTDIVITNLGTATSNTNGITWNASRQQNLLSGGLKGF